MSDERRPEHETPHMETRTFTDDAGRRWAASVMSGRFAGGEQHAEVIFVCEDVPGEPKRYARLDRAPAEAAAEWRSAEETRVLALFRDSKPA
jgi:hypothetical protein